MYKRQDRRICRRAHGQAERSAWTWIDRELLHKRPVGRKLHDLARLIRIGIDAIAVRDQQMAIRSHRHRQRAVQMLSLIHI